MKLYFSSLGCDKNLSDSEHMLYLLEKEGFEIVDDESEAEVAIVNTCCFIRDAMEESIQALIDLGRQKEEGHLKVLLACGCLAERYSEEIRKEIPEVDGIVGTAGFDSIVLALRQALNGSYAVVKPPLTELCGIAGGRILSTGGHYAYLKIAEGCSKGCSYCIIPKIRGPYRSIPIENLIDEATDLAKKGVRELNIVAQETTLYGIDLYGRKTLPLLLSKLCQIEGIEWIRLLYAYPEEIDEELIDLIASENKICHYIDMPIQHIDDDILKRMGRHTTSEDIRNKILLLRDRIKDIAIRTTLMCGFPGETESAHKKLLRFIEETGFDRLGAFMYSREEGTKAYSFEGQIPKEQKQRRFDEIMSLQQRISESLGRKQIGRKFSVFVEGRIADEPDVYVGRTYRDAPEVDGFIFFKSEKPLESGRFMDVVVSEAKEYDLIGDVADEFAE